MTSWYTVDIETSGGQVLDTIHKIEAESEEEAQQLALDQFITFSLAARVTEDEEIPEED